MDTPSPTGTPHRLPASLVRTHGDPRAARRSRIWVPVVAIGLLLFAVLNVYLNLHQERLPEEVAGVTIFPTLAGGVVEGAVQYPQHPPVGGPHAALPHLCGLYRVPLADEHAVKSLATGVVWIAYDPDLSADDVDTLWSTVAGNLDILIAPYPGLEHPVVLTAWERQLAVDRVTDPRIAFFVHTYQNNPRAPDAAESCSTGVGPIER
jgi:hypothetical protein